MVFLGKSALVSNATICFQSSNGQCYARKDKMVNQKTNTLTQQPRYKKKRPIRYYPSRRVNWDIGLELINQKTPIPDSPVYIVYTRFGSHVHYS